MIGGNVKILDNDFHPIDINRRNELMSGAAPETGDKAEWIGTKPIVIGKDCFIGTNAIILKGDHFWRWLCCRRRSSCERKD